MADDISFADNMRLKEFESLRNEISATLERRNQIIVWGGGASGATLGFAIKEIADAYGAADVVFGGFIASVMVPILLWAIVYAWLFEYERASRAGSYCRVVEEDLKRRFGLQVIGWESWLVNKDDRQHRGTTSPHMRYEPYIVFVGLFSIACSIGGTFFAYSKPDDTLWLVPRGIVIGALVVLNIVFAVMAYRRLGEIRRKWGL